MDEYKHSHEEHLENANKEVAREAVGRSGLALEHAAPPLRGDLEV